MREITNFPLLPTKLTFIFACVGWCGEVRDCIFADDGSVTVVYRVTIRGSDGEVGFNPFAVFFHGLGYLGLCYRIKSS